MFLVIWQRMRAATPPFFRGVIRLSISAAVLAALALFKLSSVLPEYAVPILQNVVFAGVVAALVAKCSVDWSRADLSKMPDVKVPDGATLFTLDPPVPDYYGATLPPLPPASPDPAP